ncbi:MAG: cyclic nucleotide-binding domain-containing protein [Betaproteobacteria bacterium]|nr:cyclic nucleotide-binding domain-containing protein [Betaproteobacteria bacterium]
MSDLTATRTSMHLIGSGAAFRAELLSMLEGIELLTDLAWREIELLAPYLEAYEAAAGCEIFREGDPGHTLCLLVRGRIRISKEGDRQSTEVATESRGRSIGEMALIDGEPRSASCTALEPSTLLVMTSGRFADLMDKRPALANKLLLRIARLMSRRLRIASGRLADLLDA